MELEELTLEMTKELILNNYNSYFTIRTLKKDFLKRNHKKTWSDKERKELGSIGRRLGRQLSKLIKEGLIERYNNQTFRIVRDNFTSITQK